MKHMVNMIINKHSLPREPKNGDNRSDKLFKNGKRKIRRVAYQIGGFWWCLTIKQWAEFRDINIGTISGRYEKGRTSGEILGYIKIVKPKSTGRPKGAINDNKHRGKINVK